MVYLGYVVILLPRTKREVLAIMISHSGDYVLNSNVKRNHLQVVEECHIL